MNNFKTALIAWYNRHPTQKTFRDFKIHFTCAKRELQKVRGKKMKQTSFQQANQVAQLQSEFTTMRDELINGMNTLAEARNADLEAAEAILASSQPPHTPLPVTTPAVNDASNNNVNGEMIQLLQQMQQQMTELSTQNRQNGNVNGYGRGNGGRGNGRG